MSMMMKAATLAIADQDGKFFRPVVKTLGVSLGVRNHQLRSFGFGCEKPCKRSIQIFKRRGAASESVCSFFAQATSAFENNNVIATFNSSHVSFLVVSLTRLLFILGIMGNIKKKLRNIISFQHFLTLRGVNAY